MEETQTPPAHVSPDEVRTMLMNRHNVVLSEDDPVLLLVSMHNTFLSQYDALLERHGKAITAFLEGMASSMAENITEHRNALLDKAVRASVTNTLAEISQHQESMTETRKSLEALTDRLTVLTFLSGIFSLIAVSAAVWSFAWAG